MLAELFSGLCPSLGRQRVVNSSLRLMTAKPSSWSYWDVHIHALSAIEPRLSKTRSDGEKTATKSDVAYCDVAVQNRVDIQEADRVYVSSAEFVKRAGGNNSGQTSLAFSALDRWQPTSNRSRCVTYCSSFTLRQNRSASQCLGKVSVGILVRFREEFR